jgi:chromosome segregation ATPase
MRDLREISKQYHELDKKLDILATRLEPVNESLESINKTLAENTLQLEIHIKGVQTLEATHLLFSKKLEDFEARVDETEKPKIVVTGILWLAGAITVLGGLFLLFKEILKSYSG